MLSLNQEYRSILGVIATLLSITLGVNRSDTTNLTALIY